MSRVTGTMGLNNKDAADTMAVHLKNIAPQGDGSIDLVLSLNIAQLFKVRTSIF